MKKYFNFLIIVFVSISLSSCFSYKEIDVKSVESVKVLRINENTADVEVTLRIVNPNKSKIVIKNCDLDASINKKNVGKINIDKNISIPGNSDQSYTLLLKADIDQVKKLLPGLIFSNKALLSIKGDMKVKMKWVSKKIKIDREEKISRKDLQNVLMAEQ